MKSKMSSEWQIKNGIRSLISKLVSSRTFNHKGIKVVEMVWKISPRKLRPSSTIFLDRRLAWCKSPFEYVLVDGQPSPMTHAPFSSSDVEYESGARRKVERLFDAYHDLPRDKDDATELQAASDRVEINLQQRLGW